MEMQSLMMAKKIYEEISKICDTFQEKGYPSSISSIDVKIKDVLRSDIAEFIMYLSASDGRLTMQEVNAYRMITGYGGDNIDTIKKYLEENNIYSYEFESKIPWSMRLMNDAEKEARMLNNLHVDRSFLEAFVMMYEFIGQTITEIDGGVTYSEKRDYNIYINSLKQYVNENKFYIDNDLMNLLNS